MISRKFAQGNSLPVSKDWQTSNNHDSMISCKEYLEFVSPISHKGVSTHTASLLNLDDHLHLHSPVWQTPKDSINSHEEYASPLSPREGSKYIPCNLNQGNFCLHRKCALQLIITSSPVWRTLDKFDLTNSHEDIFECTSPLSRNGPQPIPCQMSPGSHCSHRRCLSQFNQMKLAFRKKTISITGVPKKLEFLEENDQCNTDGKAEKKIQEELKDKYLEDWRKSFRNSFFNHVDSIEHNSLNDSGYNSNLWQSESESLRSSNSSLGVLGKQNKPSENHQKVRHINFDASRFDLMFALYKGAFPVIQLILSLLPDEDLRNFKNVSWTWRNIVSDNINANERLKAYIKHKKDLSVRSKENKRNRKTPERSRKTFSPLTPFNSSVDASLKPKSLSPSPAKFDCFIEEARKLQASEKLMKCPRCGYPSRAESGNKYCCSRMLCQYVFCSTCFSPSQDYHQCPVRNFNDLTPTVQIGSKQSKRNLRRL